MKIGRFGVSASCPGIGLVVQHQSRRTAETDVVPRYLNPKKVFKSLSGNQVPAVVIFCIALGIALINTKDKQTLFKIFDVLSDAVMKVIKFVVKLTPIGVFVMTANAAGTMSFENVGRLQAYFILYTITVCLPLPRRESRSAEARRKRGSKAL